MKKSFIYISLLLISVGFLSGCLPDKGSDALIYKGSTVVEIKNQKLGVSNLAAAPYLTRLGIYTTTAQTDSSRTVLISSRGTDSILVQLVGPQSSSPIDINYSVRTGAAYTAIEGTNYNFVPANARKVTIPANSSSTFILVSMVPGSVPTTETSRVLGIDLLGNSSVLPNANYSKFILTLRR